MARTFIFPVALLSSVGTENIEVEIMDGGVPVSIKVDKPEVFLNLEQISKPFIYDENLPHYIVDLSEMTALQSELKYLR